MKKLKFPIIKEMLPPSKWLSMDDYVEFVSLNLRYTKDRKRIRRYKVLQAVNAPFSLR